MVIVFDVRAKLEVLADIKVPIIAANREDALERLPDVVAGLTECGNNVAIHTSALSDFEILDEEIISNITLPEEVLG